MALRSTYPVPNFMHSWSSPTAGFRRDPSIGPGLDFQLLHYGELDQGHPNCMEPISYSFGTSSAGRPLGIDSNVSSYYAQFKPQHDVNVQFTHLDISLDCEMDDEIITLTSANPRMRIIRYLHGRGFLHGRGHGGGCAICTLPVNVLADYEQMRPRPYSLYRGCGEPQT